MTTHYQVLPQIYISCSLWLVLGVSLSAKWLAVASVWGYSIWIQYVASVCGFSLWLQYVALVWKISVASLWLFTSWLHSVSVSVFSSSLDPQVALWWRMLDKFEIYFRVLEGTGFLKHFPEILEGKCFVWLLSMVRPDWFPTWLQNCEVRQPSRRTQIWLDLTSYERRGVFDPYIKVIMIF